MNQSSNSVIPFDTEREQCLAKLLTNTDDKSRAGRVDQDIISFLDTLNTKRDYFSNSSCAGRIILVQTSPSTGYNVDWLFCSHSLVHDPKTIIDILQEKQPSEKLSTTSSYVPPSIKQDKGAEIWYKLEPPIIAVTSRNVESAQALLDVARSSGLKRCYITSTHHGRVILGLADTQRIETLVALNGKLLVSPEYIFQMTEIANQKLAKSRQRFEQFRLALEKKLISAEKPLPSTLAQLYAQMPQDNSVHAVEADKEERVYM